MRTPPAGIGFGLRDAALDLLLGGRCVGCDRPGRALCPACARCLSGPLLDVRRAGGHAGWRLVPATAALPARSRRGGLAADYAVGVPVLAAAVYAGAVRAAVLAHKERAALALAWPLGTALARAVAVLGAELAGRPGTGDRRVLVVPIPSPARVVRARGHDPLGRVARVAARRATRAAGPGPAGAPPRPPGPGGGPVSFTVARLLYPVRRVGDQVGRTATERAENLAGAFAARAPRTWRAGARPGPAGWPAVVVVDDVLTSGATLAEAVRALTAAGAGPVGAAVVSVVAAARQAVPGGGPAPTPW